MAQRLPGHQFSAKSLSGGKHLLFYTKIILKLFTGEVGINLLSIIKSKSSKS